MQVYFITNRNYRAKNNTFGSNFSQRGDLRLGEATVTRGAVGALQVYPNNEKNGSMALFAHLRRLMAAEGRDILVYLHGFNNSLESASRSCAAMVQRVHKYGKARHVPVVLSWPSDGKLTKYRRDRDDAAQSGQAMQRALSKFYVYLKNMDADDARECDHRVNVVAHSMGNYVLRHAVQDFMRLHGSMRILDEVVSVAADEDHDAFQDPRKLAPLCQMAQRVTVYFNEDDHALVLSDRTKGNPPRLGMVGPLAAGNLPGNTSFVDATRVVADREHWYHYEPSGIRVQQDLAQVLGRVPLHEIQGRSGFLPAQRRYQLVP